MTARSLAVPRPGLPPGLLPAAFILFLVAGIGPQTDLALFSVGVLIAGCALLWRPRESPILLFMFFYSWVQASTAIFHANWLNTDAGNLTETPGDVHSAILLSLAGLTCYAIGMRLGAGRWRWQDSHGLLKQARAQPFGRWLRLYFVAWVVSVSALTTAWSIPGLTELMFALAAMKWAFFFLVAYAAFAGAPGGKRWLILVFLLELGSGIGTYFADFKAVFFVTAFAAFASGVRFSPRALIGLSLMAAVLLSLALVWTAIKGEYRNYVSGGQAAQIITVDYADRSNKLAELIERLDATQLSSATNALLLRIAYVEFFGAAISYVPAEVPYQQGSLLWDSISRPFMPRLFFPDKAVIDDSQRTNFYTGLELAGSDKGVSFSLGWIAEMYIDFGRFGLFPACFAVGLLFGGIYRMFLQWRATRGLLGGALATAVLIGASALESSFTKTFGSVAAALVVGWVLAAVILPRWTPWLSGKRMARV
ncbi:MAG: hypothetical protein WBX25_16945 [Rhodomicrobium sp.]